MGIITSCEKEEVNSAPQINNFTAQVIQQSGGTGKVLIEYEVSDPDGDNLTIIFKEMRDAVDQRTLSSNKGSFEEWMMVYYPYYLQLEVTDSKGNSVTGQIQFSFKPIGF